MKRLIKWLLGKQKERVWYEYTVGTLTLKIPEEDYKILPYELQAKYNIAKGLNK